jgi:hypothetical protein
MGTLPQSASEPIFLTETQEGGGYSSARVEQVWFKVQDENGDDFYYNMQTGSSQWDAPPEFRHDALDTAVEEVDSLSATRTAPAAASKSSSVKHDPYASGRIKTKWQGKFRTPQALQGIKGPYNAHKLRSQPFQVRKVQGSNLGELVAAHHCPLNQDLAFNIKPRESMRVYEGDRQSQSWVSKPREYLWPDAANHFVNPGGFTKAERAMDVRRGEQGAMQQSMLRMTAHTKSMHRIRSAPTVFKCSSSAFMNKNQRFSEVD